MSQIYSVTETFPFPKTSTEISVQKAATVQCQSVFNVVKQGASKQSEADVNVQLESKLSLFASVSPHARATAAASNSGTPCEALQCLI